MRVLSHGSCNFQCLLQRTYRYDAASQLEAIQDSRRGPLAYRYDPVGRLLEAASSLGRETFAFDPASNLLREYAGTHYRYDARGNLIEKLHHGKRSRFEWDLFNRLTGYRNDTLQVSYQYDALGRRLIKQSEAHWRDRPGMTHVQQQEARASANRAAGCTTTLYGWDGDTLAWEGGQSQTTHYLYEPGSFVPLAQAVSRKPVLLHKQPAYAGGYDIDRDPLWTTSPEPDPLDALAWYQCDHLGTPQELTDADGQIVWSAQYQAWGMAKEAISTAAQAAGIRNPIRFQGQYWDHETGLHYNRHRYYDPEIGRFIGKDPIGFAGGLNVYQYADNPVGWVDPLGLMGRNGAFRQAKRDAGIPMSRQPDSLSRTPMTSRTGCAVICDGKRVETKEYLFTRDDGSRVVIQDHSAGHKFGENGIGDQGPHFNVRPAENTRNGSIPNTASHYPFD